MAADLIGGYELIDSALDTIWDVLRNDPYKLARWESDWFMARWIMTKPFDQVPGLIWLVRIEEGGDIIIEHVEKTEGY